jgi:hypothetical protein
MSTGEHDAAKASTDPRRALFQYGALGIVSAVLLTFVGWQIKRGTDREDKQSERLIQHLGDEESNKRETVSAIGSAARAIEGLAKQIDDLRREFKREERRR